MDLRLLVKFILIVLFLLAGSTAIAQEPILDTEIIQPRSEQKTPDIQPEHDPLRPVLTAQVSESQYLPPELYGTWQVQGVLISTNSPYRFKAKTYDIWFLQQADDKIRLANPDTRTETYITVNAIKDNRAIFTCKTKPNRKYNQLEQVSIIVSASYFNGTSIIQIESKRKDGFKQVEQALFQITGTKLSGPSTKIKAPPPGKFVIEENK